MTNINLGVALNFDDSNYKKGVKSVEQSLKKFSTSTAFVKLKLDDSDFRKQYQDIVKESIKNIEKSDALSYRTKGGKLKKADSIGTMQTAYKYNLEQSANSQLSKKEQNLYAKRAEYLQAHLNLIKEIGLETNSQLKAQAQIAAMPARLAQARRSGEVAAAKSKAAKEISALEKEKQLKKEIYAIDEKLDANAKSDKSEKAKLEEEVRLLSMKVKFLREQDKLAGIPQATPSAELEQTQKRLNQVKAIQRLNTLYNTQNGILTRLRNVAGQYFSLQGIISFGQKVAEITGYYQKQQIALEGILCSAVKAQSAINQLKQKALESPFMVKQLVTYTKQLAAFGIEYDNLIPTVSKLADVSVGLGVDMDRIILAYGQVKSATVLRGQELRQFTEAGIPMVEELAKKFTALNGELVTTADIFDLISKRQVSFDMVQKVMSDLTSEGGKFYKMQENITNTLAGQIEKLKDIWDAELNRIGEESGNVFTGIVKFLQQIAKNTKSVSWAMMVMIPTSYVVRELARIKMEFMKLDAAQQQQAGNMWKHASKMGSLLKGIGGLAITAGLGIAVGLIAKAIDNATRLRKELEKVGEAFDKETTKMISGLDSLTKKITAAKIGTKEYNDAVETLATNYGDFISTDIIKALQSQGDAAHQTAMEFAKIAENVKEAIKSYNEYKEIKEKQEVAKDEISDSKRTKRQFGALLQGTDIDFKTSIGSDFEEYYGRTGSNREIRNEIIKLFSASTNEFLSGDDLSKEEFYRIFEERIKDIFPNIDNNTLSTIIERGFTTLVRNQGYGKNLLTPFLDLKSAEKHSEYYGINKYFDTVDPSKTVYDNGDQIEYQNNLEAAYIEALHNTLKEKLGEQLPKEISDMIDRTYGKFAGRSIATDFNNNTVANINQVLYELKNTFTNNPDMQNWIAQVQGIFKTKVSEKTGRAAIVSDLMENSHFRYSGVQSVRGLWGQYNPNNENYEQLRNRIKTDYDSRVAEKESYISHGGKDKERIAQIDAEIEALKKLASVEYYNVDLSSKKGGGSPEQIAPELTEFLNSLKNGYSRYKEAAQKGGTAIGLGYARTDEQFQEMFGQFFGGADSEAFKGIAGLKIGDKTVGNLLQDKFLSGMEEGVLDFESAVDAVASELESYGTEEGQEEYRKAYVNAAKQLKQWSESTFSKDNLSAALQEFDQQLKKLTSTFEMTNKAVDAYRKLSAQGTQEKLGSKLGISELEAIRPQSSRQQDFIKSYVATYNAQLGKFGGTEMFNLDASSISDPIAINAAINKIDELFRMQDGNFSTTELGQSGAALKSELQKLADIMIQEMAGISAKPVTGSAMENAIAGAAMSMKSTMFDFSTKQAVAGKYGMIDTAAIESLIKSSQDQAQSVFDAFMKSEKGAMAADLLSGGIDKEAFFQKFDEEIAKLDEAVGGMPETLKFELEQKKQDLGNSIDKFNTEGGKLGLGDQIRKYRGADEKYQKEYDSLVRQKDQIAVDQSIRNIESYQLKRKINDGTATEEEVAKYHQLQTEIAASDALSAQLNARLDEIGENGGIAAQKDKLAALNEALDKVGDFKDKFSKMQDAVIAVVDSLKACVDSFATMYDTFADGENPKWLTDIQEGMGNFIENFKTAVAPILAVVGAIIAIIVVVSTLTAACTALNIAATPLLIIMVVLIAVAAIVAGIMTAIQAHDNNLEHSIEDLKKQVEEFEDAAERLNSVAERMTGIEKLKTQVDALGQSLSSASAYAEMARLEEEKKDTDEEKVKEYEKQAFEASEEFNNGIKGMLDELIGATEDWSSTMSNSIRSAFQNGDNAARSFRASIKEMMGDIVQSMLEMAILQPLIEDALQEWTNSDALKQKYTKNVTTTDENGNQVTVQEFDSDGYTEELLSNINDPEKAENAYNSMQNAGDAYIDAVENLPDFLNDAFKFNSDTSSLSGGISGITEDTARQLEGLANSMLMQQIIGNSHLASMSSHLIATIQISWFNGMLEQAKATRIAAENLDRAISDMRNGIRPMSVTMV